MNVAQFLKKHADGRQIRRCRHDVVCHLAVLHAPVLPNHFLVKREAYRLRNPTRDLSGGKNRMENAANFLQCHEVIHVYTVCRQVHGDFGDIHRPGKCCVCFSSILFIVPENVGRRFIARPRAQLPM